jgi:hypothetical protein
MSYRLDDEDEAMNIRRKLAETGAACLLLGIGYAFAAEKISPVGGPWEAGKFKFDSKENKTRRSLSGSRG